MSNINNMVGMINTDITAPSYVAQFICVYVIIKIGKKGKPRQKLHYI